MRCIQTSFKIALTIELGVIAFLLFGCLAWLAKKLRAIRHQTTPLLASTSESSCDTSPSTFPSYTINDSSGKININNNITNTIIGNVDGGEGDGNNNKAISTGNLELQTNSFYSPTSDYNDFCGKNQGLASILKCVTHTSFDVPVANDGKRSSSTTLHNLVEHSKSTSIDEEPTKPTRINIYKHLFYDPIYVDKLIEDNQLLLNDCLEPNLNLDHSTKQFHIDNPTDYLLSNSTLSSNQPFSTIFSDSDVIGDDTLIENHSPKYSKIYTTQVESEHDFCFEFDTDTELEDISNNMASTANAPPPPPPLPGTNGALSMPNWRQHPHPVRESAPSEEQIKKQQYAHLPDKLLNTMNKDKKPFTYTPQGIGYVTNL